MDRPRFDMMRSLLAEAEGHWEAGRFAKSSGRLLTLEKLAREGWRLADEQRPGERRIARQRKHTLEVRRHEAEINYGHWGQDWNVIVERGLIADGETVLGR